MNIKAVGYKLIGNNIIAAIVWFGLVLIALMNAYNSHAINNLIIFRQSHFHLANQTNLYLEYVNEYWDHFYYSPTFGVLIAPFSFLPLGVSVFAWGLFDAGCVILFTSPLNLIAIVV
jgi:hypothetical protein